MQLIEHYEVPSGGVSDIVFDDIPQTFTDLYLVMSLRGTGTSATTDIDLNFNGVSTSQSSKVLFGRSSTVASNTQTKLRVGQVPNATSTSNTFGSGSVYITNYAGDSAKSLSTDSVGENADTSKSVFQTLSASLWNSTAAITSITLLDNAALNLAQYSSATLYGITAGSDGTTTVS
jgi:hypothetical protein